MKSRKVLIVILAAIFSQSCTVREEPSSGENSFFARLNGEKYVPKTFTHFPAGTMYGLQAYKEEDSWHISIDNRSEKKIHIFLNDIEQPGTYLIQNVEQEYPHQFPGITPTSVFIQESVVNFYLPKEETGPEYVEITDVKDSLIIGEFQKITLTDPEDANKTALLTAGRFHINLVTLNKN